MSDQLQSSPTASSENNITSRSVKNLMGFIANFDER